MSAGLDASTVTPGSTAPDASFTVPRYAAEHLCRADTRHAHESTSQEQDW